jgi:two-component system response regulator GlrR
VVEARFAQKCHWLDHTPTSDFVIPLNEKNEMVKTLNKEIDCSARETRGDTRPRILLVDDEESILEVIKMRLEELLGYAVTAVSDPKDALEVFNAQGDFDLLLSDQRMAGMTGQELMEECLKRDPTLQTIIFTAYGTIEKAVEAMKAGAFSYVTKPVEPEDLAIKIEKALEQRELLKRVARLERVLENQFQFADMIGSSAGMKAVFKQIVQVAPTDTTISIYGESGTGKELVARALHFHSRRAGGAFVAVNCAAIPETLLEDELFGHLRGAYTNAINSKAGFFVQADKGTLFLDEVGEMSEAMQAKLLRVIETGEVKPLGSDRVRQVDVRLIVATKRDLRGMVDQGRFREDLYYRIHVVPMHLPPLKDRPEDIMLLVQHFFQQFGKEMEKDIRRIEGEVIDRFLAYDWPGNVRELENLVEYLVAMATGDTIVAEMLDTTPLAGCGMEAKLRPLKEAKDQFIKKYLEDLFRLTKGNISLAARRAGYYRADFYKLFQKYDLDPKKYRYSGRVEKLMDA